ncbi:hypothetical protein ACHAWO_013179 [Cyclotella atomus]|uniref:DUF6824 domain-containing protein n=1 Tax=Cyclotella atomus TaxID=382360 RepID=A0ABD3QQK1_9STRA
MSNYPTQGITNPGPHDILCGRGGGTNAHPGNIKFRKLVAAHKLRYLAASKSDKPSVAREVVKEWRSLNPPGRFLAKMDENNGNEDGNGDQPVVWYDVGDKKAREKASQCLRERNGAANEAVQALVKTVTANGEACPEDYATLMNKAAMVKARNDIALQQQKEMLNQMAQMAEFSRGFGGNDMVGNNEPQPYGLSEKMLNEYSNRRGNDNSRGFNDYSNLRNNSGGGYNNQDNFQQKFDQFQNSSQSRFGNMNDMGQYQNEDEYIEAEIKRMLQQKQAQLQMAQQTLNNAGGMNVMGGNMGNSMGMGSGMGGNMGVGSSNRRGGGGGFNDSQPYMGEDSIMKEYMQLMQKQHQMNMSNGMGSGMGMSSMGGFGGMGGMGNMRNQMNMPQSMSEADEMLWNVANGRMNNNNMMNSMGFGSNNFNGQSNINNTMINNNMMSSMMGMQDGGNFSPNNDAARNYLNRLRGMRKNENGSNPDNAYSGGGNGNMMGGGSDGQSGGRGFTFEEYQASLQEYLANDGDGGYDNNKSRNNSSNQDSANSKGNVGGGAQVFQVPTSLGDKNTAGKSGRDSMLSIGTFARNTFQSVDSNCRRKSWESVDDMDARPTLRSVDTMDMMSITNSVNDIIDDDVLRNPEMREKDSKKLAENDHELEVDRLEVKTMDHGQDGDRPKKIDPRLVAMAGTKHTVQTKQDDGPGRAEKRSSMASVDSRMSFGNMSCMSELTDFGFSVR